MRFSSLHAVLALSALNTVGALQTVARPHDARAPEITPLARRQDADEEAPTITSVSDCHNHGDEQWCMAGTAEYEMATTASDGETLPTSYSDCHTHGSDTYCVDDDGGDVQVLDAGAAESSEEEEDGEEGDCHFHAGVEHCVGGANTCETSDREYNVGLRIGLIFVVLVTSGLGAFAPILMARYPVFPRTNAVLLVLKQFGTGVILSTAFVHLYTHAQLMFSNECLGALEYEATTSAIVMAGIFISALIEYIGFRIANRRATNNVSPVSSNEKDEAPGDPISGAKDTTGVSIMEAGILFHSLLIGLTLVVAGDSFFRTLFIVIVFHQFFEGLALGTCIAALPTTPTLHKFFMAGLFTIITPIGMAIGIGVLNQFNGNDPSTIIAIGTLDAFSAGILVWVGLVEMLAHDWFHGGVLATAGWIKTIICGISLVCGMILMSVLGKWA
ncbi:hypothetical protein MBLNU230_g1739t1 [Neophaeotheca triangularis]